MAHSAYVHIPFCSHKCDFCDFTAFAGLDHLAEPYCQTVCREIVDRLTLKPNDGQLSSVFYGGGTPGRIDIRYLDSIQQTLANQVGFTADAEITLETTPADISLSKVRDWQSCGINRLSIGIESLQDKELVAMGRGQSRTDALRGLGIALDSGFQNISCDLMYGLPAQTLESWSDTLKQAMSFSFPHLSAYGLTLAQNSPLLMRYPRNSPAYPEEEGFTNMYTMLVEAAQSHELIQYEISNFCRLGYESRHNLAYWNNEEYLAFGVGAHRYVDSVRSANWRSLKRYMEDWCGDEMTEPIDSSTRVKEALFLGLRTRRGVNFANFHQKYAIDLESRFSSQLDRLTEGGFMERSSLAMSLTQKGILVSNLVMSEFM